MAGLCGRFSVNARHKHLYPAFSETSLTHKHNEERVVPQQRPAAVSLKEALCGRA